MKITKERLENKNACTLSLKYISKNNYFNLEDIIFIEKLNILGIVSN